MPSARGIDSTLMADAVRKEYEEEQTKARALRKIPQLRKLPDYWTPYQHGRYSSSYEVNTGLTARETGGNH